MNGIINVLKPPGMTSHDVVYYIRKELGIKKVGHTGTLDPEAAGVLPICIGKATKAVQYLTDKTKRYRANIKFGITTDTQDKYGQVIKQLPVPDIDIKTVKELAECFKGRIQQTPPIYSAIKHKGKKLYQYALEGQSVDIKSRYIEIYEIDIIDKVDKAEFMMDVLCSKGTYIRTLCHDIGSKSGYGAHMSQLIRLESFPFSIENSVTLEEISTAVKNNRLENLIYPPDLIFKEFDRINIKKSAEKSAINGNPIFSPGLEDNIEAHEEGKMVRLYIEDRFIALGVIGYDACYNKNFVKIKTLFT